MLQILDWAFMKESVSITKATTHGALKEVIARTHYQSMVWYQDDVPEPHLSPANESGWMVEGDGRC